MEKNKEVKITVSGCHGTGKSRITYLLKQFIKEKGFDVSFSGNYDYADENKFDKAIAPNIDEAISAIKDRTIITINEVQLKISHL